MAASFTCAAAKRNPRRQRHQSETAAAGFDPICIPPRAERETEREREEEKDRERELSFCIRRRAEQRRGAAASGTRGFVVEASEGGGIVVGRLEGVVRRKGFS